MSTVPPDSRARLRTTVDLWAGVDGPLPKVYGSKTRTTPANPGLILPDDFVIQEVLDMTDDTVSDFVKDWGPLVRRRDPWGSFDRSHVDLVRPEYETANGGALTQAEEFEAATIHASRLLRALARHVIAAGSGGTDQDVLDAWAYSGFRPGQGPGDTATAMMWFWWAAHVNAALRAFPPFVSVDPAGRLGSGDRAGVLDRDEYAPKGDRPTLYEVSVLQLVRIATGGRPLRKCASETCDRYFTIQRSERRAYRVSARQKGVMYHDEKCKRAQVERERRRTYRERNAE